MTIEERAKAKYPTAYDIDTPAEVRAEKDAYIAGATEQREIDIQRMRNIHCSMCNYRICCKALQNNDTCDDLKSIINAMKGE